MREGDPPRGNAFALSRDLSPRLVTVASLSHLGRATREHPPSQIKKLARDIEEFGFVLPILIDSTGRVVDGWGLVQAAKRLGLTEIPAVTVTDLSEAQLRVLRQALNRISQDAKWDADELTIEFGELLQVDPDIDLTLTGFEMGEIDVALGGDDEEDELPEIDETREPVSKPGDLWLLGDHRILCGNALEEEAYRRLLGEDKARQVISDPPYNVPIDGHASGLGAVKHADFQVAAGEMTVEQFTAFLTSSFRLTAAFSVDGAVHFVFIDWRHQFEILTAGNAVYAELKNLVVWSKTNPGMGSLYRSGHELIYVWKHGTAPHVNNIQLGRYGRNRTNVWDYPSQGSFNGTAKSKLALHPTVKPLTLVADAIRDCSNRGDIILDPFGGAGTTLIAAEKTGRKACVIEIESKYVDVTVERWQRLTGNTAVHAETGAPYRR